MAVTVFQTFPALKQLPVFGTSIPLFRFFWYFDNFQGVRGGQKIFFLNVLIHALELLGQEGIYVPLPYAFQPLGSTADSIQFS